MVICDPLVPSYGVPSMTTKQRSELDRAIERATAASVEVMGRGHMKGSNDRVFLVPSQQDSTHWHIVRLSGSRLVCDCQATVICVHRAAAHMELTVEAARRDYDAKVVERELERESAKAIRDAANDRRDADRWELIEAGNW